jgi:hypothetical protein
MKTGVIAKFEGEYSFLSNFHQSEFVWRGQAFQSGEHAFQYAKGYHIPDSYLKDMTDYFDSVIAAPTPAKAKYLGRAVNIDVKSWDAQRITYMREIIHEKFYQCQLAGPLINTGACLLVEGNDWGDKFWGRCLDKTTGKMVGLNTLGTILMEERGYWLHSNFEDRK